MTGQSCRDGIKKAPPRESLKLLGGPLTIEKFRTTELNTFLILPPHTWIIPSILETKCIEYKPEKILDFNSVPDNLLLLDDENEFKKQTIRKRNNRNLRDPKKSKKRF